MGNISLLAWFLFSKWETEMQEILWQWCSGFRVCLGGYFVTRMFIQKPINQSSKEAKVSRITFRVNINSVKHLQRMWTPKRNAWEGMYGIMCTDLAREKSLCYLSLGSLLQHCIGHSIVAKLLNAMRSANCIPPPSLCDKM